MALVKCPECGKENVSDSAQMCPNCGYGIKAHFEKIRQEEEERQREEKRKKEEQRIREERARVEQAKIASMPAPKKPFPWELLLGLFFAAGAVLMFYTGSVGLGLFEGFLALVFIVGGDSSYKEKRKIYKTSLYDMEKAKRDALEYERWNQAMIAEVNKKNRYKCPMCGKNAGKRISTISRAASVQVVGLASSKIGKQYRCTSCGHMW